MKKILNVAEKPSAAKKIAGILSRGTARTVQKLFHFSIIAHFPRPLVNQNTLQRTNSSTNFVDKIPQWSSLLLSDMS